ncbi:MAG: ketosteroid isomerase-like protein [Gammaproteobacteria bacterium]|jgi:ketosteroid isomerase-like protein
MNNLIKIILISLLCHVVTPVFAESSDDDVLVRMFTWWNAAMKDPDGLTEESFRKYYTEDAAIFINARERVRGIKAMVAHFKGIQQRSEYVEIVLPFEEGFESGDRIFTHHKLRAREKGVDRKADLMGYAIVEDGKLALVSLISYTSPVAE